MHYPKEVGMIRPEEQCVREIPAQMDRTDKA
jgi:hypothetical protein